MLGRPGSSQLHGRVASPSGHPGARSSSTGRKRKRLDLLEIEPANIARELTLSDFSLFAKITPIELTDTMWKKDSERAANVCAFLKQWNNSCHWVASQILNRKTLHERVSMVHQFVEVGEQCLKLNNWHAVFYIVGALMLHEVHRLKELRQVLTPQHKRTFTKLVKVFSHDNNYAEYRRELARCTEQGLPCVPQLGVSLKDLIMYDDATPHERKHKVLDISRLAIIARDIERIMACTRQDFSSLKPQSKHRLRSAIDFFRKKEITIEALSARSMELEPQVTWGEYRQRLCLSVLVDEGFL